MGFLSIAVIQLFTYLYAALRFVLVVLAILALLKYLRH